MADLQTPAESSDFSTIPQYHLAMLNDQARNHAYKQAIEQTIQRYQPQTIIDVGAGTGLLSLYAASAGAQEVIALERNALLSEIGEMIVNDNHFNNQIAYYHMDTSAIHNTLLYDACIELQLRRAENNQDIAENYCSARKEQIVDLVITEIFDSWIIGEFIFTALSDLFDRNVININTRVIPSSGDLFVQLVQSTYSFSTPPNHQRIDGFDYSAYQRHNVYTYTEIVSVAHEMISKRLSDVVNAFQFPFEPQAALDEYFRDRDPDDDRHMASHNPYYHHRYRRILFRVNETAVTHGLLFWFDLWMDREKTIKLSNEPYVTNSHWKQMFLPFKRDFIAYKNTYLSVQIAQLPRRYVVLPNDSKQRMIKFVNKCPDWKNQGIDIYTKHRLMEDSDDDEMADITCFDDVNNYLIPKDECPSRKLKMMREWQEENQQEIENPELEEELIFNFDGSLEELNYWKGYIGQQFTAVIKLGRKNSRPTIMRQHYVVPDDNYRYGKDCNTPESCNSEDLNLVVFKIYCSAFNDKLNKRSSSMRKSL